MGWSSGGGIHARQTWQLTLVAGFAVYCYSDGVTGETECSPCTECQLGDIVMRECGSKEDRVCKDPTACQDLSPLCSVIGGAWRNPDAAPGHAERLS